MTTSNIQKRCWWPGEDPEYIRYHDHEWGNPVTDDTRLFEKICLEGFQSGLSWLTILRKRENFQRFEKTRLVFCGANDRLCFHAGHGHGE